MPGAALRLLPGVHDTDAPLTAELSHLEMLGGSEIRATVPMTEVVSLVNPETSFQGKIKINANCMAQYGLRIHGMKWQEITAHVLSATSDGVRQESSVAHGIYYNKGRFIAEMCGGDGVREINIDPGPDSARFNRNAGNEWNIVTNYNRGHGYRHSHSQNAYFLSTERNSGYGLYADWIWRNSHWLGGYTEHNRRYTYLAPCGTRNPTTDNGAAATRSYFLGPRAYNYLKVGGGTLERRDTAEPGNGDPFGFAELGINAPIV